MNIEEEIERFYADFERNLHNYTRPVDYKERYLRIINGSARKSLQHINREGRTKQKGDSNE